MLVGGRGSIGPPPPPPLPFLYFLFNRNQVVHKILQTGLHQMTTTFLASAIFLNQGRENLKIYDFFVS